MGPEAGPSAARRAPVRAPRRARALVGVVAACAVATAVVAACTPPPSGGGGTTTTYTGEPTPPTIHAFSVRGGIPPAPAVFTVGWSVGDPNLDQLTCRIDGNGDGVFEETVSPCLANGTRNIQAETPGVHTAIFEVTDGVFPPVSQSLQYTVSGGATEPMDIELRGVELLDPAVAEVFDDAVQTWERVIRVGLPDVSYIPTELPCLPAGAAPLAPTVDDLVIDVSTPVIDGSGGVLGRAGPTCIRLASELPFHGIMEFDVDDVADMLADGTLAEVIEHELGHVLGIGTLWDMSWSPFGQRRLLNDAGSTNPTFSGLAAMAEYARLGRAGRVPVENSGSAGTRDAHWRESTFGTELLTGYINSPGNPLSRMTIASVADLGYRVDLHAADPYALPGSALRSSRGAHVELEMLRPDVDFG